MTETTTEPQPGPVVPEPTALERVAQLAAERAARARPDLSARLEAAEQTVTEIRQALEQAAGPQGNAAMIGARLDTIEQQLADLAAQLAAPAPCAGMQDTIDDLRLRVATLERTTN